MSTETTNAIGTMGGFVREGEISESLLKEVEKKEFKAVFDCGLPKVDKAGIVALGKRGRFVVQGDMVNALVLGREARDARERLWRWLTDRSRAAQIGNLPPEEQPPNLDGLFRAAMGATGVKSDPGGKGDKNGT